VDLSGNLRILPVQENRARQQPNNKTRPNCFMTIPFCACESPARKLSIAEKGEELPPFLEPLTEKPSQTAG
jgi:hypothetical protein